METLDCNQQECPRWGKWTEYGECSADCGGGVQTRYRQCEYGVSGQIGCSGSTMETISCNENECKSWIKWGEWGSCSFTCGGGMRIRQRVCMNGFPGDEGCPGRDEDRQECNTQNCREYFKLL